jgi:hypothetical protein
MSGITKVPDPAGRKNMYYLGASYPKGLSWDCSSIDASERQNRLLAGKPVGWRIES